MSTPVIIGILIILLVFGVPILQAGLRRWQRARSLRVDGVRELADAAEGERPAGFALQLREAVTSEEIALAAEDPSARVRQLDESGRIVGFRAMFRDPRSWGEVADVLLGQTLHRSRPMRRVELELTRYADAEHAAAALDRPPPEQDDGVRIADAGAEDGFRLREWTRIEGERVVQRMIEYRAAAGDILLEISADAEPPDAVPTDAARDLADAVLRRLG